MDVRSGGDARPAVVCCHGPDQSKDGGIFPALADRLARAGFAAVTFDHSGDPSNDETAIADLGIVLDALARGDLGPAPTAIGVLGDGPGGAIAVRRAASDARIRAVVIWNGAASEPRGAAPCLALSLPAAGAAATPEWPQTLDATVTWFARHLA